MTPMWRTAMRAAMGRRSVDLTGRSPFLAEVLAQARCFDLRAVEDICDATSEELAVGSFDEHSSNFHLKNLGGKFRTVKIDIGERACVPAPVCWLEFAELAVAFGDRDLTKWPSEKPFLPGEHMVLFCGWNDAKRGLFDDSAAMEIVDGIAEFTIFDSAVMRGNIMKALAGIALINSPSANQAEISAHLGLKRDLIRRVGEPDRAIRHTTVTLRGRCDAATSGTAPHHPKAYHFCRAHPRTVRGRVVQVRAHWRGDPAFGVRLPSYRLNAPSVGVTEVIDGVH
jgi:hypothetical protein